jgi:leader peptidase (prepilin peptidase)/N-methyltransferase
VGPAGTIAILTGELAAGAVGWCCATGRQKTPKLEGTARKAVSAAAAALAAGLAAGACLVTVKGSSKPLVTAALMTWASALAVLGLVDAHQFVVPTRVVRPATGAVLALLAGASAWSGDWYYLVAGVGCGTCAAVAFGVCALAYPRGLGFGDVRLACLVALGAGAISPPGALCAACCAPFAAGILGVLRSGPRAAGTAVAVPLGPWLALGGITAVVASAL